MSDSVGVISKVVKRYQTNVTCYIMHACLQEVVTFVKEGSHQMIYGVENGIIATKYHL